MYKIKLSPFVALVILPFFSCNTLYSQDSTSIQIDNIRLNIAPINTIPIELQFSPNFYIFDNQENFTPLKILSYKRKIFNDKKKVQFLQSGNKFTEDYLGVGSFEQFNKQFTIQYKNSLFLNTNIIIQKHEFFTNQTFSDYRMGLKTSLEYAITNKISAYIYYQISKPLNKPKIEYKTFDNLSKTLFLNNEIGSGIKAQFKNFQTNFGVNATYNSEFNTTKKINTVNTKISLDF